MSELKCLKCGSLNVSRERRPNGNDLCGECHHVWPSGASELEQLKKELAFYKAFTKFLQQELKDIRPDVTYSILEHKEKK